MGKLINFKCGAEAGKKLKSLKPVTVNKKLLKESAEIIKNAGSFKKQSKFTEPKIAVFIRSYS